MDIDLTPGPLAGLITGDQLDAKTFPPMRWAVHGLLPEGFGLFTGAPKVGKSWLVLDIALAVAAGDRALGKVETGAARPVLYLALEDGERRLQGRCRHLLGAGTPIPANLHLMVQAPQQGALEAIAAWLAIHGDQKPLVVLDTLGRVMPRALPGEGAYERDYRIGAQLKRLVDDYPGAALLVVHHVRKAASADWMESTSGTNGLNGAADFTVNLSRDRNSDAGVVKVTGRDVADGEYAVTNNDGRWKVDGNDLAEAAKRAATEAAADGLGDRSADIMKWIADQGKPVTPKQVDEALDLKDARRYLARLHEAGRLDRTGRGLYATVPSVPSVPMDSLHHLNGTDGTDGTPVFKCTVCGFPMTTVPGESYTTHATCGGAA